MLKNIEEILKRCLKMIETEHGKFEIIKDYKEALEVSKDFRRISPRPTTSSRSDSSITLDRLLL